MGFFSWKTADTKQSIPNIYANRPPVTVYMLQPNGQQPIAEPSYEGHGKFGGVDAYQWLLEQNAEYLGLNLCELTHEERAMLGISLECGSVCRDTETGEIWHIFFDARKLVPGKYAGIRFDQEVPGYGASANELLRNGRFESVDISDILKFPYPLKFSFEPDAVYEDLPESEICPEQGFFYDDDGHEDAA